MSATDDKCCTKGEEHTHEEKSEAASECLKAKKECACGPDCKCKDCKCPAKEGGEAKDNCCETGSCDK